MHVIDFMFLQNGRQWTCSYLCHIRQTSMYLEFVFQSTCMVLVIMTNQSGQHFRISVVCVKICVTIFAINCHIHVHAVWSIVNELLVNISQRLNIDASPSKRLFKKQCVVQTLAIVCTNIHKHAVSESFENVLMQKFILSKLRVKLGHFLFYIGYCSISFTVGIKCPL